MKLSKNEAYALIYAIDCYVLGSDCVEIDFCEWFRLKLYIGVITCSDCFRLCDLFTEAQKTVPEPAVAKKFSNAVEILKRMIG
ncbi:MAG: hypothetical protein NC132_02155 [Corallococcus sp.]|nr:hypothetical protein [Corallococcus sp.]MCM1358913.1 hypothetical protein [Corallococcus sp.]MCM1394901.1 hypothetical protein [Corallococcus sp.]